MGPKTDGPRCFPPRSGWVRSGRAIAPSLLLVVLELPPLILHGELSCAPRRGLAFSGLAVTPAYWGPRNMKIAQANRLVWISALLSLGIGGLGNANDDIPVSAPMNTDSAGRGGRVAVQSVVRVICPSTDSGGTGFLHHSGRVVTAEHVVAGCRAPAVIDVHGKRIGVSKTFTDPELDLALLSLSSPLKAPALPISALRQFSTGSQVSTWGFPGGYNGLVPLLSVGVLAGSEARKLPSGKIVQQWVVNAAFNRGNSGGPLLDIETGAVIGVVSSKLAPIPSFIQGALDVLSKQGSGLQYNATLPDGTTKSFSEGQVVAMVLDHLRGQVQLVVGKAVMLGDLRAFLQSQGVKP